MNEQALSQTVTQTQIALNVVWTILAACLVMFMQSGFALLETGFSRTKNVAHTMALNFLVYSIAVIGYWLIGFGLQMGGVGSVSSLGLTSGLSQEFAIVLGGKTHGLFGTTGFCTPPGVLTPAVAALFMFQFVFMATAATIVTGAMLERWRFVAFMLLSFVVATLIYPIYANWVWGGGFLSTLGKTFGLGHGHVDFAGSSVVHMTGGVVAFVGASLLGPRYGKFDRAGEPRAIPAHNIPMIVTGTFILAFGWFGFNAGSTLSGMDTRLAVIAFNTMLASAAGAISGTLWSWKRFGKPDVTMMCNGMLAGLVAITAPCAFVAAWSALLIGAMAGMLVIESTLLVERRLRIDDPVGAISVHGACGSFGALAVGIFADGSYGAGLNGVAGNVTGVLYGDPGQLIAQLVGMGSNLVWVGTMASASFLLIERLTGHRPALRDELRGLDISEMGMEGYFAEPSEPATRVSIHSEEDAYTREYPIAAGRE
ncbi:MAG TPA: ammonium transporter [Polyangiales bacterium]|nr:ammonium transporter [Polyangiales bacterium]